jgi:hypothetical protein
MTSSKAVSNRANAQRSTGPQTPAGKARVSQNALKHGLLSRKLLLPGESQVEFDALLGQRQSELDPVCTLELTLVERIAIALWRQRRLVSAESAFIAIQQQELGYTKVSKVIALTGLRESERPGVEAIMRDPPRSDFTAPLLAELARFDVGAPLTGCGDRCVIGQKACLPKAAYKRRATFIRSPLSQMGGASEWSVRSHCQFVECVDVPNLAGRGWLKCGSIGIRYC